LSHSHLIIGHITDTTVKIWVRAGNEIHVESAYISIEVIDPVTNEIAYSETYELQNHNNTFGCHVFNIHGLNPQNESSKEYLVQGVVDLGDGVTHPVKGRFKTAPIEDTGFSFFLGSCYFSQGKDYISQEYRDLRKWSDIKNPLFMMNTGDQIYIDVIQGTWISRSEEDYVDRYLDTWHAEDTRKFLSSLPQYMILDDHELYNNFKIPKPGSSQEKTFNNAKRVYSCFQHSHNPDTQSPDRFYYNFKMSGTEFFVFDVRTEKTDDFMISQEQFEYFNNWLSNNVGKMKFVVTPVPLVTQLAGKQKDKWAEKRYRNQRDKIFEVIAECGCDKLVFLTGDIHLSCHTSLRFEYNGRNWVFNELASSPIKQLQFWIVNRKIKTLKGNFSNGHEVLYNYSIIKYMGKKNNSHNADAYKLQNNAMNLFWDPLLEKLNYECLGLNNGDLVKIFEGSIEFQPA